MDSELENGLLEDRQALEDANYKVKALNKKLEETIANKIQYEENLNMAIWTKDKEKEDEQRQKIDDAITEIESLKKEIERKEKDIEVFEIILSMTEKKAKEERVEKTETNVERQEVSPVKTKKYTSKPSMKIKIKALFLAIAKTKEEFMSKHSKRREKYVPQHVKENASKRIKKSKTKNLLNRPKKTFGQRFIAKGNMKRKIQALALAALMTISSSAASIGRNIIQSSEKLNNTNSIEQENDKKQNKIKLYRTGIREASENVFYELMNGEKIEVSEEKTTKAEETLAEETTKVETTKLEEVPKEETTKVEETPKEDLPELDQDSTNIGKPNDIDTPENVEGTKPENEINTNYGGEISASENGMRTETDILFAVTQMGWSKDRIENIKEMMPGLLKMQTDFDIDPLCALAVFQWESGCGTAYTKYGQIRVANTRGWPGQQGVIGYSINEHYTLYIDFSSAAYDFGNYIRNGVPYIASPALTMADLKSHNGYTCIFNGADKEGLATYNQLKACLEKRVTLSDISNATRALTTSEIKEMTSTITSSINKQKSASKAMAGR